MPRYLFLSPHLDDAVLSCGGMICQLTQAGEAVQAITIFAGDPPPGPLTPFAQSLHERWQAAPADRRAEDGEALRLLGAQATHWPYADAVYRRHPITGVALYDSEESIFGGVAEADASAIESLRDRLKRIDPSARLIVPLTAGHHVDHQIVRAAAESVRRSLIYYEDYPYAETPEKLRAALQSGAWESELVLLADEAIRAKAAAILAYRSQMSTFFKSASEMGQRVHAYAGLVGGQAGPAERLWRAIARRGSQTPDLLAAE
ncbi:MAG TPA: PIG-L family deacetylase [Anaerolineae bacterium]|nr:PIG-L family deacetylase [Anaerolineae bacterium]